MIDSVILSHLQPQNPRGGGTQCDFGELQPNTHQQDASQAVVMIFIWAVFRAESGVRHQYFFLLLTCPKGAGALADIKDNWAKGHEYRPDFI